MASIISEYGIDYFLNILQTKVIYMYKYSANFFLLNFLGNKKVDLSGGFGRCVTEIHINDIPPERNVFICY